MSNRLDIPLALLVFGLVLIVGGFLFNASSQIIGTLILGVASAILLYAVYWGLVVRKGMALRLYRNQALSVSLVSVGMISLLFYIGLASTLGVLTPQGFFAGVDPWILLTFFWIDSSMRASQDMDPLSRDSLHWSKVRYPLWALNFVGVGVLMGFLIVTGNYEYINNPQAGVVAPSIIQDLALAPFIVTPLSGVAALPISALRSKDRNFRRQLQWFALSLLALLGFDALGTHFPLNSPIQLDFYTVSLLTTAYCLYRSARSLVPLNKIQSD